MCRNLYLQHDFIAALKKLIKFIPSSCQCIWTQLMLCCSHILLILKTKTKTRSHRLNIFRLNHRSSLIIGILQQQVKNITAEPTNHIQLNNQIHFGGYSNPVFKFDFLQPYITSDSSNISTMAHFRYVDHVLDDVKLLNYPADQYVHTKIPLNTLCELLPASKGRKIALVHGVSAGSRCAPTQLLANTVNHSCLA